MEGNSATLVDLRSRVRALSPEVLASVLVFAAFCVAVLTKSARMLEPDDSAYRASIVALTHGHLLLTNAQYLALGRRLAAQGGQGIQQWHHLASGLWISEKNPGYPFFAVLFYALGLLRAAPLFYGALACAGLFVGARRWLGRWAGLWAVALYCTSGAALVFAWRATMPSFTDASLIAAGAGLLLWALLAREATERRRALIGLLAFLAFEGAVFIRYTNLVELIVAVAAVLAVRRVAGLSRRSLVVWLTSVVLSGAGLLAFNRLVYGGITSTGYSTGEITFSTSALLPNLERMPSQLLRSMPILLLAAVALVWIVVHLLRTHPDTIERVRARRDALVAAGLAAGWAALWSLYAAYTWTEQTGGGGAGQTVHVIRFYLPVIGLIVLLGAWLLARLPRWLPATIVVVVAVLGMLSFAGMISQSVGGPGAGPGAGPGGAPGLQQAPPGGAPGLQQ
jgi:hypothetical protein